MIIRPASIFDASVILAVLCEMHKGAGVDLGGINPEKAITGIAQCIQRGVVLIALTDDQSTLTGTVGGLAVTNWYGDDQFFSDRWFYVRPEFRSARVAFALLRRFKTAVHEKTGLPLRMGVFNGVDPDRKDRFFERAGFKRAGGFYVEA